MPELLTIIGALRKGFRDAYEAFLTKAQTFARPPVIGEAWPRDGYAVPTADVFMKEATARASAGTLTIILAALESTAATSPEGSAQALPEDADAAGGPT